MKRYLLITVACMVLASCSPVLNRELMNQGMREVPFSRLREAPDAYKGKLFILGGLIVNTRLLENGSQIEALYVPVDAYGYLTEGETAHARYLAVLPRAKGLLDPMVYKKGRQMTLAGEFIEIRKGKIDEMEYPYPVFEIKQVYLFDEDRYYPYPYYPYYYPYYSTPFMYDRWGRPYPNPYWPPPW